MSEDKWFYEENLIYPLVASTKEGVIGQIGELLYKNGFVKDTYTLAVISREQEFATGLPTAEVGVAIPHTDAHHVLKPAVGVGILANPVPFVEMGNSDDDTVDVLVVFMLAVPDKNKIMTVLQQIIAMIQDREFLKELISITDRTRLVGLLDKRLNVEFYQKAGDERVQADVKANPEINLIIQHPVGLHARPATIFVQKAKQYTSDIWVTFNGKEANAKSILRVLTLGAGNGAEITIRAEGEDAREALSGLKELVESNFGGVD